jgi:hypoxanthine phosphoribosyltransferase
MSSLHAKQDPDEKARRAAAARSVASDGKIYFSYAQVASAVMACVPAVEEFKPDVFVAIGGGGFIPARMLRTKVKKPILAISLELYDDATNTAKRLSFGNNGLMNLLGRLVPWCVDNVY